ncbi:MAG: adenylate kinase [Acidimicrobiia bacterium]|nr:adenylate kinase [Acidimicrobiia bacterium]MCY4457103.1 adenylate kinase [Acidimicrobiaceae bacterium]
MSTLKMVILGRQGSGKGTQSLLICEAYGAIHVSTGEMLRSAVAQASTLGLQAQQIMESGSLVSDEIMNGLVAERFNHRDITEHGVLLDGFPRTVAQANALESILEGRGQDLDIAINLDVPLDIVTDRMLARSRKDDTPEAIKRRLDLYEKETEPLLDWFTSRNLLHSVDGVGSETEVFARISASIADNTEASRLSASVDTREAQR